MSRSRRFALALIAAVSVAVSFELSAFADSRHSNRTRGRSYGRPHYASGHVSRFDRYRGGYRVWLDGGRYPFFVPRAHYHPSRFRVGVYVGLGGYYNPRGYFDYYCYDCYGPAYRWRDYERDRDGLKFVDASVRGTIRSIDAKDGKFVIHAEGNDSDVTALMRGHDRGFDDLQVGDYVEISGQWTRTGYFEAYAVDFDPRRDDSDDEDEDRD